MKRILIFGGLLLLIGASLYAQTIRVTGRVTDATDGTALPGVSVLLQGTTLGVATDANGNFALDAPANGVLVFSFVGMTTAEVPIEGRTVVNVALVREALAIDEFIVTGYALQRRRDLTGSVASIRGEALEQIPISSIDRALQGRAAGVQVTAASGIPGGAVSVVIRGIGSFGSIAPLYIIDGVQVQTGDPSRAMTSSNALAGLNPEDIASIEVLKDASATAIFGSRGANGVVIITTKRGREQEGGRTRFDFQISQGFSSYIRHEDVLSGPEWIQLDMEAFFNRRGRAHADYITRRNFHIERGWLVHDLTTDTYDFSMAPTFDWQDAVYRLGSVQDVRFSASGGARTRFFLSGSYNHMDGHVINSHFTRGTLRVNLDHDVNNNLRLENNTNFSVFHQNTVPGVGRFANPVRSAWQIVPMNPIYNPDGTWHGMPAHLFGTLNFNVVGETMMNRNEGLTSKLIQSNAVNWNITDNIAYRGFVGIDVNDVVEDLFHDPRSGDGRDALGDAQAFHTRWFIWQTANTLTYNQTFGRHRVGALAGFETLQRKFNSISAWGSALPINLTLLSAAATTGGVSAGYSNFTMVGMFGRLDYTFDDRYIASLSVRRDGNSRFGAANRWGTFPAASLGWRISHERFMDWTDGWLDNLMFRVSYGIAGADAAIGDFAGRLLYASGVAYLNIPGLIPTSLPNNMLTWEESRTINLGLSATAFNGRINLDVDAYRRESSKLLMSRPLPPSTGWTSISQNVGAMRNEGIEITLNTVNIVHNRFRWSTDLNFATLDNVITALLPGQDYLDIRTAVGRSLNDWFVHEFAGVNPADGRPMYYDIDGNITYIPRFEDRRWFGPQNPTRYGGITNTFQFGNLTFSFFLQYSGGNVRSRTDRAFGFRSGNTGDRNQFQFVFDNRWRNPGDMTFVPRPMQGNVYGGSPQSFYSPMNSMFLERVDYLRLKDVNITYELPRSLTERIRLSSLQVFAQATNLLTWTTYGGLDPEFTGDDFGVYPQGKMVTLGLRSSF